MKTATVEKALEAAQKTKGELTLLRAGIRTEIVLLVRDSAGRHFEIAIDGKDKQTITDADKRDPMDGGASLAEIYLADPGYPESTME